MAILDRLPGIEVTISCNGIEVEEYDDHEDEVRRSWKQKTVSKYIESVSDTDFYVQLRVGPPYEFSCDSLDFIVIPDGDGEECDSHICHPDDFINDIWEEEASGREIATARGSLVRKYRFAKLETTDEDINDLSQQEREEMAKVGLIEVRVHEMGKCQVAEPQLPLEELKRSWDSIPEKILKGKAVSHRVIYGDEVAVEFPSLFRIPNYIHGWDAPVGVFRFKYRSRDDLQKQLIIPRPPFPEEEGPRSGSFDTLTTEERRQWARLKFDETQLLNTLGGPISEVGDLTTSPMFIRLFGDLDEQEVNMLAQQKYAEMMRTLQLQTKHKPAIKLENRRESSDKTSSIPRPKAKQYSQVPIANGKMAIDFIEDSADEDVGDDVDDGNDDEDDIEILSAATALEELKKSTTNPTTKRAATAEAEVEAGQEAATNTKSIIVRDIPIETVSIPPPDLSTPNPLHTPIPHQLLIPAGEEKLKPFSATTTATGPMITATERTSTPEITTQPSHLPLRKSPNPPSRDDGSSDNDIEIEILDVREVKRRKIGGFIYACADGDDKGKAKTE